MQDCLSEEGSFIGSYVVVPSIDGLQEGAVVDGPTTCNTIFGLMDEDDQETVEDYDPQSESERGVEAEIRAANQTKLPVDAEKKGPCVTCGQMVWSTEPRLKNPDGNLRHHPLVQAPSRPPNSMK